MFSSMGIVYCSVIEHRHCCIKTWKWINVVKLQQNFRFKTGSMWAKSDSLVSSDLTAWVGMWHQKVWGHL